jgi:3-hydroxybenzoate 6-monooxygenase
MNEQDFDKQSVVVAGGGIGGLAAALALSNNGYAVTVFEQAHEFGEIGAGIQLGPNAFHALDRLGVGPEARSLAVYIDDLILMDGPTGETICKVPVGEPFRKRFGNPYAVIHRADVHGALLEGCRRSPRITLLTSRKVLAYEHVKDGVRVILADGSSVYGGALVGADGLRSRIREQVIGDGGPKTSGHICYRAVLPIDQMPEDLRWNAATLWASPGTHLVHYPLSGWKKFNIVATFQGEPQNIGPQGLPGDRDELLFRFRQLCPKARKILETPPSWKRWVLGDREPVDNWSDGVITLLGDAAHPMHQYFAQGACMAMEDAVCLGDKVAEHKGDFAAAFQAYQALRVVRTGRVVLSSREIGRHIYHPGGIHAQVRSSILRPRTPEQFYDSLDWIYGGPQEYRNR